MWRGVKLLEESGSYIIIELRTNYSISSTFVCLPIDFTLEKCSIKYIWNLINDDNKIYVSIVKLSLCNNSTTLGENIRYFSLNIRSMITNGMNLTR